jgi:hypothetical protein
MWMAIRRRDKVSCEEGKTEQHLSLGLIDEIKDHH